MQTLTVNLAERSYPIYIGSGLLSDRQRLLHHIVGKQVMIVSDEKVAPLYLQPLVEHLKDYQVDTIVLPDGEATKTIATWEKILTALFEHKHHRTTTLIALGGGVVGDITGFAAACYQRGVAFIQLPTSLLAQVDAAVGGKTAVNHPLGKNMIGAFYQPRCVLIDTNTLNTLPDRELSAGLAEVIKAALIRDHDFFTWLENHISDLLSRKPQALLTAIYTACHIKVTIVAADEHEHGQRVLLNLGHTFGHAIESCLGFGHWLHGEAVAVGLVLAAKLSVKQGLLDKEVTSRLVNLLTAANLPITLPTGLTCHELMAAMTMDKKVQDGQLRLVLLNGISQAIVTKDVTKDAIMAVLQESGAAA